MSQYDVKDFFYRLGIPWTLSQYFGLPPLSKDALRSVVGPEPLEGLPGEVLHPYFRVLPMGFSWAQ